MSCRLDAATIAGGTLNLSVLGLGYIGLPTAAMLANGGNYVTAFDVNPAVRRSLQAGEISAEDEVRESVLSAVALGRLVFSDHVHRADGYIVCVPTPVRNDYRPDLSYVHSATELVLALVQPGNLIILESTVPPGTVERTIVAGLRARGLENDVLVAHCPERVNPGDIIRELRSNPRVIGGVTPEAALAACDIYKTFVTGELFLTTCKTAEMVKVMENVYRDVNIALANELAVIAEDMDVDIWEAIRIANHHPRVGILSPGPGTGGHCIPIDPHFLIESAPFITDLIQAARRVNKRMPHFLFQQIQSLLPSPPYGRKLALLGAAYKANVTDSRETLRGAG